MEAVARSSRARMVAFGIALSDVRMKRANLPKAVQHNVSRNVSPWGEGRRGCPRAREGRTEACVFAGVSPATERRYAVPPPECTRDKA
jgi:hypothetical protein